MSMPVGIPKNFTPTSFDPQSQNVGTWTTLDAVHYATEKQGKYSDNPLDPNWGGVVFSENVVESGKYDGNQVTKPTYFNARNGMFQGVDGIPEPVSYTSHAGLEKPI